MNLIEKTKGIVTQLLDKTMNDQSTAVEMLITAVCVASIIVVFVILT